MSKTSISNKQILIATLVIIIFILLTLADSPRPEFGIIDLYIYNEKIVADNYWDTFCSDDGGFSWKTCDFSDEDRQILVHRNFGSETQISILDSHTQYRINDEKLIQKSIDDGQTWEYAYFEDDLTEIEVYYIENHHPYGYCEEAMLFDAQSGNVLVAMGFNGIIVIDRNNNFLQIGIEDYKPVEIVADSMYNILITPFIIPSVILIIFLFSIHTLGYKNKWYWFAIIFSFLLWLYSMNSYWTTISIPDYAQDAAIFSFLVILLFGLFIFSMISFIKIIKAYKTKWYTPILGSFPAGPLFYFTYALWFKEIIPSHNWALVISHGIIVLFIIYANYQAYQLSKSSGESNE